MAEAHYEGKGYTSEALSPRPKTAEQEPLVYATTLI